MRRGFQARSLWEERKERSLLELQSRRLWWEKKAVATKKPAAKKPAEKKSGTEEKKPAAQTEISLFHKGQITLDS